MANGNRIKIRHGTGEPSTSNLLSYELGWNGEALFINNNGLIKKLFGDSQSFTDLSVGNLIVTGSASFVNSASFTNGASFTNIIPTAPTAPSGTNNTQLATTAFVTAAISGQSLDYLPLTGGTLSGDLIIDGATLKFYNDSPFRIKYGSIAPTSASLQNNDIYFCTGEVVADVNALAFDGAYSAETNKAATVSSITTRVGNSKVFYGTCASTAATVEKQVVCNGFTNEQLIEGVMVIVKFDVTNSAAVGNITLKVGDSTAKNIKYIYNGNYNNIPAVGYLKANQIYHFTYDGTYWIVELNYNTDTTYTFDGTYNASTNKAATVSTVTNAINALDVSNISGFGAGKTLVTLTETNGLISATFQNISITKSQISDFPTSMPASDVSAWAKASTKPSYALSEITGADDVKAIEALTGTSGLLKKTAANTWTLDTTAYTSNTGTVTSITLKAGTGISLDTDNTAITTSGTRTITNSGVRATTINGNYLRVNTNGTNADLTIPYAKISSHASAAHFSTQAGSPSGVLKVKIKAKVGWMLTFTLRVYQGYSYQDFIISGYNYGTNYWYSPKVIIGGGNLTAKQTVTFGYDSDAVNNYCTLWVSIPIDQYTGADIFNVTNGYSQISDLSTAFEIIHETTSTGTVQTTVDAYRPWYRDEKVSSASNADSATTASKLSNTAKIGDTNQPVYFTASGVPAAISYTIAKSVPSNAVFTDTWTALSTSAAGYVAKAPNDTTKFLRGDATWAAVTATNVGLGNVSNSANLNSTTGAKGDIIYWSAANTPAHLTNTSSTTKKFLSITSQVPSWTTLSNSDVGLGNVENTKLSTWTGSTAITTLGTIATGSIPLNNITSADDLKAIEALTGTTGFLKKTGVNQWTLDTNAGGTGGNGKIFYGTCSTAAATGEKAIVCDSFTSSDLTAGTIILVKFTNTNTAAASNLKLNINSTGANTIYEWHNGSYSSITNKGYLAANQVYEFIYNGTYWVAQFFYDMDTTYTFDGTYNASTNPAATVSTVTNAIGAAIGGSY